METGFEKLDADGCEEGRTEGKERGLVSRLLLGWLIMDTASARQGGGKYKRSKRRGWI